jgi:hypothetical protein
MFTMSRIALSFAVVLSAASVPLATRAFVENSHLDWDPDATISQIGKGERARMNQHHRGNSIRGEDKQQQGTSQRWIDDPASPVARAFSAEWMSVRRRKCNKPKEARRWLHRGSRQSVRGGCRDRDISMGLMAWQPGVRRRQQVHAFAVDGEQRRKLMCLRGFEETRIAIVENEPPSLIANRDHGVILLDRLVTHQHKSHIFERDTGIPQSKIFGNCIILAISPPACKRSKWRQPHVNHPMLFKIACISDRAVDRIVDRIELGAAGLFAGLGDKGEKTAGGRRPALVGFDSALAKRVLLGAKRVFDSAPFDP